MDKMVTISEERLAELMEILEKNKNKPAKTIKVAINVEVEYTCNTCNNIFIKWHRPEMVKFTMYTKHDELYKTNINWCDKCESNLLKEDKLTLIYKLHEKIFSKELTAPIKLKTPEDNWGKIRNEGEDNDS